MLEKMSKSRGNAISVDEVTFGVMDIDPRYEFRHVGGEVIRDFKFCGVWRDTARTGDYFTGTRQGRRSVFLHEKGNPVPAMLRVRSEASDAHYLLLPKPEGGFVLVGHDDGAGACDRMQHPEETAYWKHLLELYENAT